MNTCAQDIISLLEELAPPGLQESYDNSGLQCGTPGDQVKGVLATLDCTEEVVDEAIQKGCNLIITHHPVIFKGLKKLTGSNYVERTILKAVRNNIVIYAIHTNLDNVSAGVNRKLSEKIGLSGLRILNPLKGTFRRLIVFCPEDHAEKVRDAVFSAGAGRIGNYDKCSFNTVGTGTFRAGDGADPFVGEKGKTHAEQEVKVETVYPLHLENQVLRAMIAAHPYEEVAYDILELANIHRATGAGMIGDLDRDYSPEEFLKLLNNRLNLQCIRHTALPAKKIRRVAVCGGSGSFLLEKAKAAGADAFVTGDFKYHQFFDADGTILVADIGHFESERFTPEIIRDVISEKFTKFAVLISEKSVNPVKYYF